MDSIDDTDRHGTTHHPQNLRLRSALLLLVEIMNGLDHWHSRHTMLMTWVGIRPSWHCTTRKNFDGIVPGQLGTRSEDVDLSIAAVVVAAAVVVVAVVAAVVAALSFEVGVVVAVSFEVGVVVVAAVSLEVVAAVVVGGAAVVGNKLGGLVPSVAFFILGGTREGGQIGS